MKLMKAAAIAVVLALSVGQAAAAPPTPPPGDPSPPGANVTAIQPVRIYDSRPGQGNRVNVYANQPIGSGQQRCDIKVAGPIGTLNRTYVPTGAIGINAVFTVTDTSVAAGYLTGWAASKPKPLASLVNWFAGETKADWTAIDLDTDYLCVYNGGFSSVNFIIDLMGYSKP